MTFYQRTGLAGALIALFVGTTAEEPWNFFWIVIGGRQPAQVAWMIPILMAGSIFLLLTGKDRPDEVTTKWYGVISDDHLAGPFLRMEDVTPGCHGITPYSILQVFGDIVDVGVILHPGRRPEPAAPDRISLTRTQWYVADSDTDEVWAGPFESGADAIANLDPNCTEYARLFAIAVPISLAGYRFAIDYYEESPAEDEDGKSYWVSAEPFDPESN